MMKERRLQAFFIFENTNLSKVKGLARKEVTREGRNSQQYEAIKSKEGTVCDG